jgi:hypothetical protein
VFVSARRFVLGMLVWLCVPAGVVLVESAPAFAAAPEAPSLELVSRKATPGVAASLRGVLYPNATGEPGSYEFLYEQSASECSGGSKTASGIATGNQFEEVSETLTGLQSGKQYTVCLSVTSPGGTTLSAPVTFTAPIAVETPNALKAEPIAATTTTLHGVLNPGAGRETEPGSYAFLYKRSASECEGESATPSTAAAGAKEEAVSAPATELLAHTTYTFCLRATNEVGEAAVSAPVTFTTLAAAPDIEEASVNDVTSTSATFVAKVNPDGSATTYAFEYAPVGGSFVAVPEAAGRGSLVEGSTGTTVSVHVQVGLLAHSEYEFRVMAANAVGTVTGEAVSFTTQTAGGELELPDHRQWELVTPPNKHGAQFSLIGFPLAQAAEDGGGIAYETTAPTEAQPPGFGQLDLRGEQALAEHRPGGWSSHEISPPHVGASHGETGYPEFQFFSADLSAAFVFEQTETESSIPLLSTEASENTPYVRHDAVCGGPSAASECYRPILTGKEGFADVPPGIEFGHFGTVELEGAAPDLNHVVLRSLGSERRLPGLFEWSAGAPPSEALQQINLLPTSEGGGEIGGTLGGTLPGEAGSPWNGDRHAVSDDGSRVFWTGQETGESYALYMRDTVRHETVRLDVRQPGAPNGGEPKAIFAWASSDGSKAFFTDNDEQQRLTVQSGHTGRDLYECEISEEAGRLVCKLTDLTPEAQGESAGAQREGVLGASEDGSYVYFTATTGVLGNGAQRGAVTGACNGQTDPHGTCNLYEYHDGKTTFIAALSDEDEEDYAVTASTYPLSQVSPDGRYLAFMSAGRLTSYDNRDAVSGKPDQEVYLYDALEERLSCVSCNPTGSRPTGLELEEFTFNGKHPLDLVGAKATGGDDAFNNHSWIAANLPHPYEINKKHALYQRRALANGGRVFFDSNDALVPQDVNGQEDVYEFEPAGTGTCSSSSVTFSTRSGGCTSLISSGSSPEESAFLDASKTGGDVFFVTNGRLTSQDYDTSYDIYDAHECSSSVPCVAQPTVPPPCSSGDSCKGPPALQPPIFGAPASATFNGAGNITGSSTKQAVSVRSLTRAQKLARAVRACRKRPKRSRSACIRRAKRRYGANAARRSVTASGRAGGR